MTCLHPLKIINPKLDRSGYNLSFECDVKRFERHYGKEAYLTVPCGKCEACIERKSNDWACRIYHEWLYSDSSAFFTLTYSDEFLTYNDVVIDYAGYYEHLEVPVLCKRDVQLFMKRLRKKLGNGLRFFLGGEYGEQFGRPHYHFVLFNYPKDVDLIEVVKSCWSYGNVQCSEEMNIKRVMYVAKYIYCSSLLPNNRAILKNFVPPFILCSRMPGLGYQYVNDKEVRDYHNRTLETRVSLDDGKQLSMPRYFRNKIFNDESKEKIYQEWINNPPPPPTEAEVYVFLKRFNKKKRGKSI